MNKVALREWRIPDAERLSALLNNPRIHDNLRDGLPYPYTVADGEEFIRAMLAAEPDTQYAWAVCVDGEVVGSIGAFRQENIHRLTAEMGYYVNEAFWGRGVATEAVKLACSYIFGHTDIIRIYAEPFADNAASCCVLEKAGFTLEGVMRNNAVKNGIVRDMKLYAVVK